MGLTSNSKNLFRNCHPEYHTSFVLNEAENLLLQGRASEALPLLAAHCVRQEQDARAWFLYGAAAHQCGGLALALEALQRALALDGGLLQARSALGAVLSAMGRPVDALQVYEQAARFALPVQQAQLLTNMGIVLEQMQDGAGALKRYDQALALQPDFTDALLNRGVLLLVLGRAQEALQNNLRLVALHPDWGAAQHNLGEALLASAAWQEALSAYEQALKLQPDSARSYFGKGLALSMLQRFAEAQQCFDTAQNIDPQAVEQCMRNAVALSGGELRAPAPKAVYLYMNLKRFEDCDWAGWEVFVPRCAELILDAAGQEDEIDEPALVFHSLSVPLSVEARQALLRGVARYVEQTAASRQPTFIPVPPTGKRLRIGYVSPDFGVHPVGRLTRRLYHLHARKDFEIVGYALTPHNDSAIRRDIEQGCDHFRVLHGMSDIEAAQAIHADGIDILVNLAGYTTHARNGIFALHPAPLQVSYNGFPSSMGASFMHYFITDEVCSLSGQESQFTEALAYLPHTCMIYNDREEIAARPMTRAEFGLPQQAFVFCCFNNSYKIEPAMFEVWMRILKRTPGSVLWLYGKTETVKENLRREANVRGVAAERLVFAFFEADVAVHLARYHLADLFLDTLYFNAGTTAADALWAGLPLLTCPGTTFISRWAASMLKSVGMEGLICASLDEYEERACHLALHPQEMSGLKARLAQNRSSAALFDTERHVRSLEKAYLMMWRCHVEGLPPASFKVS